MADKTYSNRSNALRAAKKQGYTADQVTAYEVEGGRWAFEPAKSEDEVKLDNEMLEAYGMTHCPGCGVHLENGVCDFEGLVDLQDGDMNKALKLQTHEFACSGCDYEFGKRMDEPETSNTGKRRQYKRTGEHTLPPSEVESACAYCHRRFDELYEKGEPLVRKEYLATVVEEGVNWNNASTEFSLWRKKRGYSLAK